MIQLTFLAAVLVVIGSMKAVSVARAPAEQRQRLALFWIAPTPSLNTWNRRVPPDAVLLRTIARGFMRDLTLTAVGYGLYWTLARWLHSSPMALSYLAALPAVESGLALGWLGRLTLLPLGIVLPPVHGNPLAARRVSEFWGRGWNRWINEWFREALFFPRRHSPQRAAFLVFLFSAAIHELAINGAGYLVAGTQLWGRIALYFLLQWAGMRLEAMLPRRPAALRHFFCWLVLLGPAPLFFGEPILRILFLWPY